MKKITYSEVPVKGYCTLERACAYLMFGLEPLPTLQSQHNLGNYELSTRDKRYTKTLIKVIGKLCNMLKLGKISAIYPPKSCFQRRMREIPAKAWKDITPDNINDTVLFNIEQLKSIFPAKQYTMTLEEDGTIYINDGNTTTKIKKIYPGHVKYERMRFYFDRPNETLSEQDITKHFAETGIKYDPVETMNQCIHNTFVGQSALRYRCFPIDTQRQVKFTPNFISTDALVL